MTRTEIYKAYIAANRHTRSFDYAYGKTPASAQAAVRRKNSPDWHDLFTWVVYVHEDGQEERL